MLSHTGSDQTGKNNADNRHQDNQEKQPRNIGTCVKFNEFFIQHYFLFMVEIEKISLEFFRIIFDGFISEFYKLLEIVMIHCRQQ